VLAIALFARPAEMIRGALDSGVYINDGIALGRTGEIFQHDILMRQLDQDTGEVSELLVGLNPDRYTLTRLRMPGFYVYDKKAALVVPQHYSLYPVWIGLLYSLFGIWGALYATPLLMLLLVLAVYFFARRALASGSALLALALLVLCPVTIWFARYPVSEVMMGVLAFGAFFAFMRMLQVAQERDPGPAVETESEPGAGGFAQGESARQAWASLWGVVAGLALGELALARPDFIFYWVPVPLYLLYWRLSRTWKGPYTWFAITLGVVLGLYLVHLSIYSFPYTLDLYHNTIINLRRVWRPGLTALYVGVILLVAADRLYPRLRPIWRRSSAWVDRRRWVWAGAFVLLLGGYALYHYVVAPWLPNVRFDNAGRPLPQTVLTTWESYIGAPVDLGSRYNLLRIGWYLSPLGVVLGVAGLLRWIWTRLNAATGLFFGCLLVVGYVFIDETYTDAHYIYTMRRYVPVILPALILGIAWCCQFLWSRVRPRQAGVALAAVAALGLAVFFAYTNRALVPHVEDQGAVAQLSALAARFPPKSVVLFSNERDEPYVVATPLQYIFGIESFALTHSYPQVNNTVLDKVVTRWQKDDYKVWVMMGANGGKLDLPSYTLKAESSWAYDVPEFEQLYNQKPSNVSSSRLPWTIYSLQPRTGAAQPSLPFKVDIGNMDEQWLVAGFYAPERAPGDTSDWRWTGDHAIVRLPWPSQPGSPGTLDAAKLTLRLRPESPSKLHPATRTQPVTVTLTLENDKTPIGRIVVPPGSAFTDYTISVPAGMAKAGSADGYALLNISSPTWSAQQAGLSDDTRALGIQLDEVRIEK
jgi:4-amino-4-deoxy-L-arabinose transferase-like glycosyltransferase